MRSLVPCRYLFFLCVLCLLSSCSSTQLTDSSKRFLALITGVNDIDRFIISSKWDKPLPNPAPKSNAKDRFTKRLMAGLAPASKQLQRWRDQSFKQSVVPIVVDPRQIHDPRLAGWYEIRTQRLIVVMGRDQFFSQSTLLHELHHALQDQNWNLNRIRQRVTTSDQAWGLKALIEGEAMLAVAEIMNYDFEKHMVLPRTGPISRQRFEKIYQYGVGLRFVRTMRKYGGWEAVNAAWRHSPLSSTIMYHPTRYGSKSIKLPKPPSVNGRVVERDQLGEFELRWLIVQDESARAHVEQIAASFLGDHWRLVRSDNSGDNKNSEFEYWTLYFSNSQAKKQLVSICDAHCSALGWSSYDEINETSLQLRRSKL